MKGVKVTLTTEVIEADGTVSAALTVVEFESGGNPRFISRMGHRGAEVAADTTRVMLAGQYGEIDPEWKANR